MWSCICDNKIEIDIAVMYFLPDIAMNMNMSGFQEILA